MKRSLRGARRIGEKVAKEKSDHSLYMHCSLLYAGSRLMTTGHNTGTAHAEALAIKKYEDILRTANSRRDRNLHMVNIMVKRKTGMLGNSYPCHDCRILLRKARVKSVVVFREDGESKVLNLGADY